MTIDGIDTRKLLASTGQAPHPRLNPAKLHRSLKILTKQLKAFAKQVEKVR